MDYNFYDTPAFLERIKHPLGDENIIICDSTFDFCNINSLEIPSEFIQHIQIYELEDKMFQPLDKYDPDCWKVEWSECLAAAFDYDTYQHPDETIFISNSSQLRDLANRFFGDDSIYPYPKEGVQV